ncbi:MULTISPECIES: hypothetical protein [unclassified Microbacterium]|uniref:hypothetical protein n=1 Tax=unclassified Microbacterium TaxID=2609290 RepID=UPI00386E5F89
MATTTRFTGALDLIVFGVAVALSAVVLAVVEIVGILAPAGPAVTVAADAASDLVSSEVVTAVTVRAAEIDLAGRLWLISAELLLAIGALVVVAALIRIALAVRREQIFAGGATRALTTIAVTLTIIGFAWPVVDGMGRQHAVESLGIPFETLSLPDLLPMAPVLFAAITAAVLAGAFAHGERLRRDTEGLV